MYFESFEALKAFDGYSLRVEFDHWLARFFFSDGLEVVFFFGSYHTVKQPEYCYTLTEPEEMETIRVTGRRNRELEKPSDDSWSSYTLTRSIRRSNLRQWQQELDGVNQCWQALDVDFEENDDYEYKAVQSLGKLGTTNHEDEEIQIGISDIRDAAISNGLNYWQVLVQTSIHEWIHVEQGPAQPRGSNRHPWRRVELEFAAQKGAYDRYIAIYNREPSLSYSVLPPSWETDKSRYTELFNKLFHSDDSLTPDEIEDWRELNRKFRDLENGNTPVNKPAYSYSHFDLCG